MAGKGEVRKQSDNRGKGRSECSMKDRLYYVLSLCVGQTAPARVTMPNGDKFLGNVFAFVRGGVTLHHCQNAATRESLGQQRFVNYQSIEFTVEDAEAKSQKFKSDGEIARSRAPGRRELQKYAPETPVQQSLDEQLEIGKFDQFEANQKLFGVNAKYDEDQYTTPLVRPEELTSDQLRQTEQIIKALARSEALDDAGGEMEEEARFAAVKGTGRFKSDSESPSVPCIVTKVEKQTAEKSPSPCLPKNEYIAIRDNLQTGRRLDPRLEGIEALLLEPARYTNEDIAAKFGLYKEQKVAKDTSNLKRNLEEFKSDYERKSASRKNSVIDMKTARAEESPLTEIVEEPPASLLDLYLDSLAGLQLDPVSPHWPVESAPKAASTLNPDAPEFVAQT